MELRLIVLRTSDTKRLSDFYSLLGLTLEYHRHGNSPYHYSATIGPTVLEIYPLAKNQMEADKNLRIGLAIDNFERIIQELKSNNATFSTDPAQTQFGFSAIVQDPDGRKIELYRKDN